MIVRTYSSLIRGRNKKNSFSFSLCGVVYYFDYTFFGYANSFPNRELFFFPVHFLSFSFLFFMVYFGQVVIGPPGAGKTTYCAGILDFCTQIGRSCAVINLDFANDTSFLPYTCACDVRELVSLERVMEEKELGPNGGLLFCIEYLLNHLDWLISRLNSLSSSHYLLFDCPGQVEIFTHEKTFEQIVRKMEKLCDIRLCSVILLDSFSCSQPSLFISSVLLIASMMLRLSLPNVNVLTKIDLLHHYGPLPYNFDFFTGNKKNYLLLLLHHVRIEYALV